MSAKKTDISQIRKYLNGELDARAMHQLEREAQDDPFLMDALEGYELKEDDQQAHLADLDTRLEQRINKNKVRKLLPWRYMATAAAVLLVVIIGYLLRPAQLPVIQKEVALNPAPADHPVVNTDTVSAPVKSNPQLAAVSPMAQKAVEKSAAKNEAMLKPAAPASNVTASAAEVRIAEPVGNADTRAVLKADTVQYAAAPYHIKGMDSTRLKEVTVVGYGTQKKEMITGSNAGANTQSLLGKVPGAQVTPPPGKIMGTVLDENGQPLPGVSISIPGKNQGAQTDFNGRFSINAASADKETLNFAYIGFESKQVKAGVNDSLRIALRPASNSLNEVVVTGFNSKALKPVKEAQPKMGWDNYHKYLDKNTVNSDAKTGNVRISFTVDSKGNLNDFKIIKGMGDVTNQQAIELVKSGPAWAPAADHQPKTIKLKIHFSKQSN